MQQQRTVYQMVFQIKLHPCAGIEPLSDKSDLDTSAACLLWQNWLK